MRNNFQKRRLKNLNRRKKTFFRNKFFWVAVFCIFIIGCVFYLVFFSPFFQIKTIEIKGNNKIVSSEINAIISAGIEKKIVFLETKSIFWVDGKSISENILKAFFQIKKAEINKRFPDRIIADIEERIAVANFCGLEMCFHIDRDGVVFESGENNADIIIKDNDAGYNVALGQEVLKREYIIGILKIHDEMERNFNLSINNFIVSGDKLEVLTPENWRIYFDLEGDFSGQIVNLISVLKEQILPEKRAELDYIDLRFGENKIFYKYK